MGPVVGHVLGRRQKKYTIFGNTVSIACRMESTGVTGKVLAQVQRRRRRAPPRAGPCLPPGAPRGGGGQGSRADGNFLRGEPRRQRAAGQRGVERGKAERGQPSVHVDARGALPSRRQSQRPGEPGPQLQVESQLREPAHWPRPSGELQFDATPGNDEPAHWELFFLGESHMLPPGRVWLTTVNFMRLSLRCDRFGAWEQCCHGQQNSREVKRVRISVLFQGTQPERPKLLNLPMRYRVGYRRKNEWPALFQATRPEPPKLPSTSPMRECLLVEKISVLQVSDIYTARRPVSSKFGLPSPCKITVCLISCADTMWRSVAMLCFLPVLGEGVEDGSHLAVMLTFSGSSGAGMSGHD